MFSETVNAVKNYCHYIPQSFGVGGIPMPDRSSIFFVAGLVGGSLILTLTTNPNGIMIPLLITVFTGIGLAVSPDRSFI